MQVSLACVPAPGVVNEDHVVAAPDFVCVLDGVTTPEGLDHGCVHGTPWLVQRLAAQLVDAHTRRGGTALPELLAEAIEAVRGEHGGSCDLEHPGSPATTVCILRAAEDRADYLVLGDSPLVLERDGQVEVITDLRIQRSNADRRAEVLSGAAAVGTPTHAAAVRRLSESQRSYRNRTGGYWVAAGDPAAAHQALTGAVPLSGPGRLQRAALLTDGASRAVDTFSLMDWPGLLDVLTDRGPGELIRLVRAAELADEGGAVRPRYKKHDDATAVLCTFPTPEQP